MEERKPFVQAGKMVIPALCAVVLALMGMYLFFGESFAFWMKNRPVYGVSHAVSRGEDEVLTIAYAYAPYDLNPLHFDPVTRSYLVDVYEGLVQTDASLTIEPALALSWGMLDDYTWEFRLRPGALFHNGDLVKAADVQDSLEYLRTGDDSQLKVLLSTITAIETKGENVVRVTTKHPDPLLLNKLALAPVFPEGYRSFFEPIGAGPYAFVKRSKDDVTLKRFDGYWGKKPAFVQVVLKAIENRRDRTEALERGEVQVLGNLPPNVACSFQPDFREMEGCTGMDTEHIHIRSLPGLEVAFLGMNVKEGFFQNSEVRAAVAHIIDRNVFRNLVYGYARPATQLVGSGMFGYSPATMTAPYSLSFAREELGRLLPPGFERISVTFDYPETLQTVAQYVRDQFVQVGIDIVLNPLSDSDLRYKVMNGESQLYYLGWRFELADALDVLQAVVHSRDEKKGYGELNGSGYSRSKVDALIEQAQQNLDSATRLRQLQEAMRIAIEDDVIAIPLFEPETIFAFSDTITFEPRIDGYIHASEIR